MRGHGSWLVRPGLRRTMALETLGSGDSLAGVEVLRKSRAACARTALQSKAS